MATTTTTTPARLCIVHGRPGNARASGEWVCPAGTHVLEPGMWVAAAGQREGGGVLKVPPQAIVNAHALYAIEVAGGSLTRAVEGLLEFIADRPQVQSIMLRDAARRAIGVASGVGTAAALDDDQPLAAPPTLPPEDIGEDPRTVVTRGPRRPRPAVAPAAPASARGLELVAATNLRDLMRTEVTVPAGIIHLGNARRGELLHAIQNAAATARESAIRTRWLRLVADALPDKRRVREVLGEDVLQGLHRRAQAEMALVVARLEGRAAIGHTGQARKSGR